MKYKMIKRVLLMLSLFLFTSSISFTQQHPGFKAGVNFASLKSDQIEFENTVGFGGGFGRGALRVGGVSVEYYNTTKANWGVQIGANQYAHVLFFMTEDALTNFRASDGWELGANVEAAIYDDGQNFSASTTTNSAPVISIIFGQAGLKLGVTIEGTKYSKMNPPDRF